MNIPTPHLDKLKSLLNNEKLPDKDQIKIHSAIDRYRQWIGRLNLIKGEPDDIITTMVDLLNEYRLYIDVELIFDSPQDFLYRQKGQLKLDNSVLEEFIPLLIKSCGIVADDNLFMGTANCFSSLFFISRLNHPSSGGEARIRTKNQDFAIARPMYIRTSHHRDFSDYQGLETHIAYVSVEIKTNLDKTMFQEACATAHDVKMAVTGAKYYLLCEWLDMTPVSTVATDIDEVLILRGKRLNSNIRANFGNYEGRMKFRDKYVEYLQNNPFRSDVFIRFVNHIKELIDEQLQGEDDILSRGYF